MTSFVNDFNNGSNGATIDTSNSASSGDAFGVVTTGGGAPTYTTSSPIEGAADALISDAVAVILMSWDDVAPVASFSLLMKFQLPTLPLTAGVGLQIITIRTLAAVDGSVAVTTTGQITPTCGTTTQTAAGGALTANAPYWIRVQGRGYGTGSAGMDVQLYDDTGTLIRSTTQTGVTTTAQAQRWRHGRLSGATGDMPTGMRISYLALNTGTDTPIPLPAVSFNGTLDTSGSGTLAGAGTPSTTGTLGLSGAGMAVFSGTPAITGADALSGSGTLTGSGTPGAAGALGLSGAGTLTMNGTPSAGGTRALSGSGALTFTGGLVVPGTLALSGAGTLTAAGSPSTTGVLGLSGTGTLSFSSTGSGSGTVALSGSGTLSATGTPGAAGTLGLSGAGTLAQAGTPAHTGAAALSGSGTLARSGTPGVAGALGLSGAGTLGLSGSSSTAYTGALGLSGVGALGLLGTPLTGAGGGLTLGGVGTLSSAPVLALSGLLQLGSIGYLAEQPGGRQVGLTPSNEMVAVAWLKATVPYLGNRVATSLPNDNASWAASGFTTVATIGGTPNIEVPVSEPVFDVSSWGVSLNSGRLPWNLASQPAEAIKAACVEHGEIPKIITMPAGYNLARVLSVVPLTEPRRVGGDAASYAHYSQDVEFRWVKT